jgi:uncharacterized protein
VSNVEIVRRMYEALERSDRGLYRVLTAPDVVWQFAEGFPHGGTHVGQAAVFEGVFPALMREFSEWHLDVEEILDAGETVVGLGRYRGRARRTGRSVVAGFAHVFRVQNGQIVRVQQFTDTVQFARALAGQE